MSILRTGIISGILERPKGNKHHFDGFVGGTCPDGVTGVPAFVEPMVRAGSAVLGDVSLNTEEKIVVSDRWFESRYFASPVLITYILWEQVFHSLTGPNS